MASPILEIASSIGFSLRQATRKGRYFRDEVSFLVLFDNDMYFHGTFHRQLNFITILYHGLSVTGNSRKCFGNVRYPRIALAQSIADRILALSVDGRNSVEERKKQIETRRVNPER